MSQKNIELAKDPDLVGSWAAIQRAAKRAVQVASSTNTELIVFRDGKCVRVRPSEEQKPR